MSISLFSAVLGGGTALFVVFLTHIFTLRREEARHEREIAAEKVRWLRENRQRAYHNALKYLFRVAAIGAKAKNTQSLKLPDDADEDWYSDISEANAWLSTVHYYCSPERYDDIGEATTEFLNISNRLIGFRPKGTYSRSRFQEILTEEGVLDYQNFVDFMNQIENTISNAARKDLGALDAYLTHNDVSDG
jgi:hypothetical protein